MTRGVLTRPSSPPRPLGAAVGVFAWALLCVLLGGFLLARHLLTLPTPPAGDPSLVRAIAATRSPAERGRWLALHVLYDECGCSQRVLDSLLSGAPRTRLAGVVERVVYISDHAAPPVLAGALAARGFALDVVTPDQLGARYHLEAAPLLVVVAPDDTLRYLGGYTPRKQIADVRDVAIITLTRIGVHVAPLPTFGCAVSTTLRDQLDPLAITRN
jgi:hypothetical protein